jgi:hypothetical protein
MAFRTLIFVSKRLQRVAAAVLCLMAIQLAATLPGRAADSAPAAARVAIGR